MHAYAAPADMIALFGDAEMRSLSDIDSVATGAVVTARLESALQTATGEVDGYLVGRYALPLATIPQSVKTHVLCMARYHLMGSQPDERALADRKVAFTYLMAVSSGKIPLFPPAEAVAPSGGGDGAVMQSAGSVFARDGGW